MSLHTLANHMAQTGRGPDSMLVHMSPREVNGLQALAKAHGGSLTINPETGLPEAGFLDKLLPMLLGIVLAPATGGASLGITEAWQTAALVGGISTLATGSLEKGLMAGFGAYGGAGIGGSLANAGVSQIAAEELVKQGTLTPADVGNTLAGSTVPNTSTFVPGADGMPATAMAGTPVGPPTTAVPFDPYSTGANPYALGNAAETAAYPGAAQASGMVPPPGAASSAMAGTPGPAGEFESLVGNGANQMSPEAYADMASKSVTPEQLAAAKQQMIEGIKNGTVNPFASLGKGIQNLSATGGFGQFAKANMLPLGMAASQLLLSQPKPTTSGSGQRQGYIRPASYDPYSGKYTYYDPIKTQDYTHAKNGGLMGLANGGAVAFADGGTSMTSPYLNGINNPETIPLMSGETQDQGLARMQGYQTELDERNKRRMEAAGMQAPATIDYTQSPAGLNPSSPTVQTQADVDYWTKRTADAQGSPFVAGGGGNGGGGQDQVAYIKSLMANNPAPVGPTNAQMMAAQDQERAELAARRAAVSTGGNDFSITGPNSPQLVTPAPVIPRPNVPAAEGTPTERARAQGIQSLAKPDVPRPTAQTDGPPITRSGIEQLVHGSIYDPTTGHFRNPTAAELGAKAIADAKGNTAEMTQLTNQYFDSYKAGEVLDFAGGTLTKNADGTATHKYTDANGKQQTYTFSRGTDIATIANSDPNIANEWKGMFNYTPPKNTGSPIISTPGPTGPVLTPGTGSAGHVVQTPTGFTPTPAPPTRVPTSIEDFNTRFNKQTDDSAAQYDYLMGKPGATEPKQTQNAEVMKPYWEAMGTTPVDKTRSEFMYDKDTKKYIKNPDYVKKVMDPTTKRLVPEVTATDNKDKKPTTPPDSGMEWTWDATKKQWVQTASTSTSGADYIDGGSRAANGGLMGYAAGGLGSLGGYSDGGQLLRGDGDGVSDSIPASIGGRQPARLADGEFVVPARIVSELGNGSTEAGARRLYQMMDRVQGARRKSIGKNKVATNSRADKYLPA